MPHAEPCVGKLKIVRVVTASYVVPWHLANTLKRMPEDFDVTVVGQGVSAYRDIYPGVHWIDLELERKAAWFSDLKVLFALCRIFRAIRPDIAHSIMPKAGLLTALAGFLCRVPVRLHTFTGQVWATRRGMVRVFYYAVDRLINSLNTTCLTDSPSQSAFLLEHGISCAGGPLPVLSKGSLSGVDLQRFNKQSLSIRVNALRNQLGLSESDIVFAFIARKTRDKGAIDMLKAFSRLAANAPNARLLFVGPDESAGEVQKIINTDKMFENSVLNIGSVKNHEEYLAICNVLCLPSYREGFGTIVIDAAAMEVPAIGSRIPGLVDAIEDGRTGMLLPPGDIDALARAMRDCLEHPEHWRQMGRNARVRVEQLFSADILYQALKELYLELAAVAQSGQGRAR